MVAHAHCSRVAFNRCVDRDWRQLRRRAIYLYFILMDRRKELESIIVIAAALIIIHFVVIYKTDEQNLYLVPVALGLLLIGFLSPWLTSKIIWLWFKLSEGIGYVMSRVILSTVFFLFLFPISVLYRLFNKDALRLKRNGGSTYVDRSHTYTASDLENPW